MPTVMLTEDGTAHPPTKYDLDDAEHSVAIVFGDDHMVIGNTSCTERASWSDFVFAIAEKCRSSSRHRFLPLQLSQHAWPMHDRLRETNFIAAHNQPETIRYKWLERRLMIELSRFLLGKAPGDAVPVKVFLSHAKHDISHEPKLFEAMATHLNASQPIEPWIDSGQIQPGTDFRQSIESAVKESAVVVLATAAYSSRPWCRREVLFAKQHSRPVVVVNGLKGVDVRSFPYIGNVPVISWVPDGAQQVIDLLLKEVVRIQHNKLVLDLQKEHSDFVLPTAPELVTLAALHKGKSVLYPDPPLSDEEVETLSPLGIRFQTPLQRSGANKTLTGRKIALSISESNNTALQGLLPEQLDEAMVEISRHLLVRGATLVYGGHLGEEGYTQNLANLVQAHQNLSTLPQVERIVNYIGWPLPYATMPIEKQAKFARLLTYVRTPRPEGVAELDPELFISEPEYFAPDSAIKRFAWSRGMSVMREQQSNETDARIVIGGKVGASMSAQPDSGLVHKWYAGRIPGVIEEALFSIQAQRPIYACGAFGGAASLLIDLLEGKQNRYFTWDYQQQAPYAVEMRELYRSMGVEWLDYSDITKNLANFGIDGLARNNGLTVAQNHELFRTRDVSRMVALIMEGLSKTST